MNQEAEFRIMTALESIASSLSDIVKFLRHGQGAAKIVKVTGLSDLEKQQEKERLTEPIPQHPPRKAAQQE